MVKTMTIEDVIMRLQEFKKVHGDIPVILAEDTEGNGYGTLKKDKCFFWSEKNGQKVLIINPFKEHLDYDEIWEVDK